LKPLFTGLTNASPRKVTYHHYPGYLDTRSVPTSTIIKEILGKRYKLQYFYEDLRYDMYCTTDDIGEATNLLPATTSQNAYLAANLSADLRQWLDSTGAIYPTNRATGVVVPPPTPLSAPSLTVTENSFSRAFGVTNPVLTGSLNGLFAGDNITATFSSVATTNSPAGVYPITFTFSDPNGKLGFYTVITNNGTLTVRAPSPISITSVKFLDPLNLQIAGTGDTNVTYRVQASSDLINWQDIGTAMANGSGAFEFVDGASGGFPKRFYRVIIP
jgi:hypothetical protein